MWCWSYTCGFYGEIHVFAAYINSSSRFGSDDDQVAEGENPSLDCKKLSIVVLNLLILLTIEVLAAKWVNLLIHRRKQLGGLEPKFLRCETHQAGLPGLYNSSTSSNCIVHCIASSHHSCWSRKKFPSSSSALQELSLIPDQQTWIVISVESLPYLDSQYQVTTQQR